MESQKEEKHGDNRQDAGQKQPEQFPTPEFSGFITGLYTQTLLAMGAVENPATGEKEVRLKEAQFLIDTIGMLELKTRGNLSDQEAGYLQDILNDLRMRYVSAAKKDSGSTRKSSGGTEQDDQERQ